MRPCSGVGVVVERVDGGLDFVAFHALLVETVPGRIYFAGGVAETQFEIGHARSGAGGRAGGAQVRYHRHSMYLGPICALLAWCPDDLRKIYGNRIENATENIFHMGKRARRSGKRVLANGNPTALAHRRRAFTTKSTGLAHKSDTLARKRGSFAHKFDAFAIKFRALMRKLVLAVLAARTTMTAGGSQ